MLHTFGGDIDQEVLDLIWNNTADAIFTICHDGSIRNVNPSFEEMLGWNIEELKDNTFPPFIIDMTEEQHRKFIEQLEMGNNYPYSVVKRETKNGETLDILASYRSVNKGDILAVAMYKDFTGQMYIQDKLEESEHNYRTLVEHLPEAVIKQRYDKIEFINSAGVELFGQRSKDDIIGKTIWDFFESIERKEIDHMIAQACKKSTFENNTFVGKLKRIDGEKVWTEIKIIPIGSKEDPDIQIVIRNVTERKNYESKLEYLAYHDPLTGLKNRRIFTDMVNESIEEIIETKEKLAMMYIDMDNFKEVNDEYGHDVGDQLLQHFAERLKNSVRKDDILCRVGGDEFLALLRNVKDKTQISRTAERMIDTFQEPYEINGLTLHITASIGISILPDNTSETKSLIFRADEALYKAKEQRNQYLFYSEN
ncbi:diguanylate cyclase domain-containing protein [Oceanobacillus sp. CAU 1775]